MHFYYSFNMSADLRSAIVAACTPTGADQAAANVWLNQFSETDAAWEATARLLGDSDEQVRFFAANILLAKTRKSWHCLSLEVQQRLLTSCRWMSIGIGVQFIVKGKSRLWVGVCCLSWTELDTRCV